MQVRLDILSDQHVHWLNDLESDRMYHRWSNDLMDLLRPMFPGQLSRLARNIFNAVFLVDPASVSATLCVPSPMHHVSVVSCLSGVRSQRS